MSQRSMRVASSYAEDYSEAPEYFNGSSEEEGEETNSRKDGKGSKHDTWLGIFVVTQFWVICAAGFAFLVVAYAAAAKLSDRETLETKDRVSQSHTWFKLAICLRPFMTEGVMKELYRVRLNRSFSHYVESLNVSEEEKAMFRRPFYFDDTLEPQIYQYYFTHIHPWKDVTPNILWEYQNISIRKAFEEFRVNRIPTGTTKQEKMSEKLSKASLERYTILPSPKIVNASKGQPLLFGEYFLSPIYLGCLSMTVNQEMGDKPMEIDIKFRPQENVIMDESEAENKTFSSKTITLFEGADIFLFNRKDTFTEIPTVKKYAKFSVSAVSRERLLVKNSMYSRQRSSRRDCEMTEMNSEMICRQDCIYRGLLKEINCTLPWMERFQQNPALAAKYHSLPLCGDVDSASFLETIKIQEEFMCNIRIMEKGDVQNCLQDCKESCKSSLVRILLLGSKSIGSNYGVTLTVSPTFDVVTEHFNYSVFNLVSELCASISFLLGLSAIAIYDWLVAFGVWAADKMGLYVPEEEGEEGESLEAGRGGEISPVPPPPRRPSPIQRLSGTEAGPAAARSRASELMQPEPKASGPPVGRKHRVSLQLSKLQVPGESTGSFRGSW